MINSNLGHNILHRLETVHPWRTDGRQPWQQLDHYSSMVD